MDINTHEGFLIGDSVYIVGHKKPDLDAVVSAFKYQIYRHSRGDFNYVGIICDQVNHLTKWLFERFNQELPPLISNVAGKKIVLVDHTDPVQRADGWEDAQIIEVVDHHNLKLKTTVPPKITIRPYGSTCTLIALKLIRAQATIQPDIAGLILSAILDDTLALRSPITTYVDRSIAGQLGSIAGITDIGKFARELFEHKDIWGSLSAVDIIDTDRKDFDTTKATIQISQAETLDNQKLVKNKGLAIYHELERRNIKDPKDIRIVMVTDLLRGDCIAIVSGKRIKELEGIFNTKIEKNGVMYLPGVLSRKKDVVPKVLEYFN